MRAAVLLLIGLFALAALIASEHSKPNADLPLVKAAAPIEGRVIIPWMLNTRCSINSSNLPQRDPERNA